jgi:hypothetical protein
MHSYMTFIALDIAGERAREADRHRLAALARSGRARRTGAGAGIRQPLVAALNALSRGSAAIARRLEPTRS